MSDLPTRILVADDNATDRLLLSSIVKKEGYEVISAVDGADALCKFDECVPDVVLLDAMMPKLDGFEVAKIIRKRTVGSFVPIVFLTSLTEADELARCLDAGGDDFLSKPYNKIILKAKLNALDRMRALHTEVADQRDQISRHHAYLLAEQEAAKAVFDNVAHSGQLHAPYIKQLISPLAVFNGDVVLAAHDPGGDLYVLLGDFTGHGLTAAIGAMPLADTFYGMTAKGFSAQDILREANRKLHAVLPAGYFCCATLLRLNFRKGCVEYWNGGLPAGVLLRTRDGSTAELTSTHLALGILDDRRFDAATQVFEINEGDKLLLCTDGVVEARNPEGEDFGYDTLRRIAELAPHDRVFEAVRDAVYGHLGSRASDDDLTLVEVSVLDPAQFESRPVAAHDDSPGGPKDWSLTYELGARSLAVFNPLPLLQHILMEAPHLRPCAGEIYTVLSELYSNALEHGVMGLDSSLKNSADGFSRYYEARAAALENLQGFVRFEMQSAGDENGGTLTVRVKDSGAGFDYPKDIEQWRNPRSGARAYHGRGLVLLGELCESVRYRDPGNEVEVVFRWEVHQ